MTINFSFDRVARRYDEHRAHPPAVSAQIGEAIVATVGAGARLVEYGVGTGRIALPVAAAGGRVVGIDIAASMLREAAAHGMTELVQGDVKCVPLRDDTADAVVCVHVLHLVPDWRGALGEAARILRPGGALIQGRDWRDPQSCAEQLRMQLRMAIMALSPQARPPAMGAAIGEAVVALGGDSTTETTAAEWTTRTSPAAVIAGMAQREDAETWALDDDLLGAAIERVQAWAATTWDDLEQEEEVMRRFIFTVTRGTWRASA
jgi:ubiquinone/menaquinone biosynthesis C-methylase UbiE